MEHLKKIEEEKTIEKKNKEAKMTEIVLQKGEAFELETGEIVGINELLLRIYNKILKIEKSVG